MLTTDQKGAIAEYAIVDAAIKLGIGVYRPPSDGGRYDLIFDLHPRLVRGGASGRFVGVMSWPSIAIPTGGAPMGGGRCYTAEEVDAIAAYCLDLERCDLLPIRLCSERTRIFLRLATPRNNQKLGVHWADDFDFRRLHWGQDPGAIAQLGERRAGSAKVAGSSPAGSIIPASSAAGKP